MTTEPVFQHTPPTRSNWKFCFCSGHFNVSKIFRRLLPFLLVLAAAVPSVLLSTTTTMMAMIMSSNSVVAVNALNSQRRHFHRAHRASTFLVNRRFMTERFNLQSSDGVNDTYSALPRHNDGSSHWKNRQRDHVRHHQILRRRFHSVPSVLSSTAQELSPTHPYRQSSRLDMATMSNGDADVTPLPTTSHPDAAGHAGDAHDHPHQRLEQRPMRLYHPDDFLDEHGNIPYPKHLSPSSAMTFRDCPQSFLLQYIYKLSQPTNLVLAKGSMCHTALEHIFDLDPPDRSLTNLQNMLRAAWSENRLKDEYKFLFEQQQVDRDERENVEIGDADHHRHRDIDAEREWGQSALRLLENYYISEDPRQIVRPNPYRREVWVHANLTVDPTAGATAPTPSLSSSSSSSSTRSYGDSSGNDGPPVFKVRGIVDRLDMVRGTGRKVDLKIVDYKTGKAPTLKYSNEMNRQIYQKNFFQLKIYALLMREKAAAATRAATATVRAADSSSGGQDLAPADTTSIGKGMDVRYLKLYYLDSDEGRAKPWEMDLGETQEQRDEVLYEVHQELAQIWTDIIDLVDKQDPKAFHHCDRPFCSCHTFRPQFVAGTLWENNEMKPPPGVSSPFSSSTTTSAPIVPEIS